MSSVVRLRYAITGTIEVVAPLHVGSGEARQLQPVKGKEGSNNRLPDVAAIVRDARGLPYLPPTTTKGLLRRIAEDLPLAEEAIHELFGEINSSASGRMGRLVVRGASADPASLVKLPDHPYGAVSLAEPSRVGDPVGSVYAGSGAGIFVMARTRIDPAKGTAKRNSLFHEEVVAAGARFPLMLILDFRTKRDRERASRDPVDVDKTETAFTDLLTVLSVLTVEEGVAVGKGKADGLGRLRLLPETLKATRELLGGDGTFTDPVSNNVARALKVDRAAERLAATRSWRLTMTCDGPFAAIDSSFEDENEDKEKRIQLRAQRGGKKLPLLFGTSLTGALRSRARWLAELQILAGTRPPGNVDNPDKVLRPNPRANHPLPAAIADLTDIERLFGVNGFQGRLEVRSLRVHEAKRKVIASVKLDRFTGGPIDNALFKTDTFVGVKADAVLALSSRGAPSTGADPDIALAKALFADISREGEVLVLGHGGNKGFGWFSVEVVDDGT